jgi:hypothetical protein
VNIGEGVIVIIFITNITREVTIGVDAVVDNIG